MPKLIEEKDGLRTYEPEPMKDRTGKTLWMQLCEEWVEGRWEPFYSVVPTPKQEKR